jgi:hypothetical protein
MPRNNRNSAKGNSNQFELLATEEDGTDDNTVGSTNATSAAPATSTRGRPLKRTQPYDPESLPRKKSVSTKTKATKTAIETDGDSLLRIETLLKRAEERAERAEKRVEALEEFIRDELFPRVGNPVPAPTEPTSTTHQHLPPSPPSWSTPRYWVGPEPDPGRGDWGGMQAQYADVRTRPLKRGT